MEYHRSNDSLRHAKRREVMDRIRWKVRKHVTLKAERENNAARFNTWKYFPRDVEAMYQYAIRSDGHWAFGGCSKTRCGLCHYYKYTIPTAQQLRINEKAKEELAEQLFLFDEGD